ncbi:MAG: thioredoxin domain-containing protein [Cyanobacteria bacterium P01_E01_bin.48]
MAWRQLAWNQFAWRQWSLLVAIALATFAFWASAPARASTLLTEFAALKQLAAESVTYSVAATDSKPALVEFYADWCSICRAMAPTMTQLHEAYGDRVNFVMLDIDDPHTQSQVQEFGVQGVPYYAFVSPRLGETDRSLVATLIGRHPAPVMTAYLERLLADNLDGNIQGSPSA